MSTKTSSGNSSDFGTEGSVSARAAKTVLYLSCWILVLATLLGTRAYNFLLFHSVAEVFSMVIAVSIFVLAWNSRQYAENHYLIFLGIGLLFVGILDGIHMLAYKGMGVFPGYGPDLPTQLWIASRFLQSFSLVLAPLFIKRRVSIIPVFWGYTLVTVVLLSTIFFWEIFPDCFLEPGGLTRFKVASEYCIVAILIAALGFLFRQRQAFEPDIFRFLSWSIILTVASELCFTLYRDVYDILNMAGHLLKIMAFYLIYRGLMVTGITRPQALLFRNLQESEERLRWALQGAGGGAWDWDLVNDHAWWSEEMYPLWGVTPGTRMQSSNSLAVVWDTDRERVRGAVAAAVADHVDFQCEFRIQHLERGERWMASYGRPMYDQSGQAQRLLGITLDITERRRAEAKRQELEAQLFHAQKIEAIGTLAGGIAHDFNNILTAIIGFTELAQFGAGSDSMLQSNLGQVLQAAQRAKDLVKQILTFSRADKQDLKPVQASLVLSETLKFLRSTLPSTIEIRSRIEAKNAKVMADPTLLHRILMNLCANAGYAMRREGGVLGINLTETVLQERETASYQNLPSGPYLRLEVSDTGEGIPPAALERIFEPFFTTKPREEGTGLGLAVVHGIIKSLGGDVWVVSEVGRGTTFYIYLPLLATEEKPVLPMETGIPRGHERILFVDDEVPLTELATLMLSNLGYQVTTRTSPVEALQAFRDHPDSFDLVITDQTMPHLTGDRLVCELLRLRPDIPIILCTGFSEIMTQDRARRLGIRKFLMKPLAFRELAGVVREALMGKQD